MTSRFRPAKWPRVSLGDVVERHAERCERPINSGYELFVGVDDLDSDDLHVRRYGRVDSPALPPTFRYVFRAGMVLFPTRRPALRKCAVAETDGITGEKVLVLKSKDRQSLNPLFLPFLLASDAVKAWAAQKAIGSVTPHFRWVDLAQFPFLLPPKDIQADCARALLAVDDTKEHLRSALRTLGITREAYLEAAFRSGGSPTIPLADALVATISGGTPSRAIPKFWGGSVPWLSPKDMKRDLIGDTTEHITEEAVSSGAELAPPESVFIVVRGMILAHTFPVCRTQAQVAFNQDIKALVFRSHFKPSFAQAWLQSAATACLRMVSETSHGTKRLETNRLMRLRIPNISEERQSTIVGQIAQLNAAQEKIRDRLRQANELARAITAEVVVPS